MGTAFQALLQAAVEHLEELKSRGVRTVEVAPATLQALFSPGKARPDSPVRETPVTAESRGAAPAPAGGSTGVVRAPGSRIFAPVPAAAAPVALVPAVDPSPTGPGSSGPSAVSAPFASEPPVDRAGAMAEIRLRALECRKCPHLVASRTQVVFGVGSVEAELMFIGEAPGAEEDRQGEPFVGPAGQLLTRIIGAMGFSRESVYIANILKCRPDLPPGGRGNRAPRPEEMDTCKPYLLSQVEIIRPKVIVALGLTAVQGLLNVKTSLGAVRGRWQVFRGIPVMPTFHPSYLLRSEDGPDKGFGEKRKAWEDLLQVLGKLEKPISDKMRGYFLRPTGRP